VLPPALNEGVSLLKHIADEEGRILSWLTTDLDAANVENLLFQFVENYRFLRSGIDDWTFDPHCWPSFLLLYVFITLYRPFQTRSALFPLPLIVPLD